MIACLLFLDLPHCSKQFLDKVWVLLHRNLCAIGAYKNLQRSALCLLEPLERKYRRKELLDERRALQQRGGSLRRRGFRTGNTYAFAENLVKID